MTPGYATPEGTARYAARFPAQQAAGFYRSARELSVSSLGVGTYLGKAPDYIASVAAALRGGINFFDTSLNYHNQDSERAVGSALHEIFNANEFQRDQVVVCTKAGVLVPGAVPPALAPEDVAGRMHSMAPGFLSDQIARSRANLQLATLDVLYLHNPETQLGFVGREDFDARVSHAFERLERHADEGSIRFYGMATWDGFRKAGALDLAKIAALARDVAGGAHRFRFIQLPFNLGMVEAFASGVLDTAAQLGITVVASATLLQTQVLQHVDATTAIQFTRSTPGISVALVGMSNPAHVESNLAVSTLPPLARDEYLRYYR